MFHPQERYQTHCRFCPKTFEGDSAAEAVKLVEEHEKYECPNNRVRRLIEAQITGGPA